MVNKEGRNAGETGIENHVDEALGDFEIEGRADSEEISYRSHR
jgi:hypothetical protein